MKELLVKKIATSDMWNFWQIGDDVFRCTPNEQFDIWGLPMAKRWECNIDHWRRYRTVFSWAIDC